MADNRRDFVRNRVPFVFFWVLPPTAMIATVNAGMTRGQITLIWTVSLLVMSTGCFVNAIRCGRLHCAITGPFFLLMAVLSFVHGQRIVSLGGAGWETIGVMTLIGGLGLTSLPERIWGKYLGR